MDTNPHLSSVFLLLSGTGLLRAILRAIGQVAAWHVAAVDRLARALGTTLAEMFAEVERWSGTYGDG